jgi:hypothetical protein
VSLKTVAPERCCPRCDMPAGVLALLTSMVAYYVCARCSHRWLIAGASGTARTQSTE